MSDTGLVFVVADGEQLTATGPCILGRAPGRDGYSPVALDDPERATSKNHLIVRRVGELCELTDLDSTNGSAVEVAGRWVPLEPSAPTHATLPCRLDCGGVIVAVEMP